MKHIIRAIFLLIILYIIGNYYRQNAAIVNIIGVLLIIAFIYLLFAIIFAIGRAIRARKEAAETTTTTTSNAGCSLFIFSMLLLALAYVFKNMLGAYSHAAFLFTDNLLQLGTAVSPVVGWSVLGLLVGSIYGSFVAWKKYKLSATISLIPIGVLILFIAMLYLVNKPLKAAVFEAVRNTQTAYAYNLVTAEAYDATNSNNTAMYKPAFLLDSSNKTAWITDVAKSNAEVRFSFKSLADYANKDVQCIGFIIKNGYRKSPQLWSNFARAKGLAIKHNGSFITAAVINDKNSDSEEIKITPVPISSFDNVSVNIQSVYEGEKYATRVAITELVPIIQYKKE